MISSFSASATPRLNRVPVAEVSLLHRVASGREINLPLVVHSRGARLAGIPSSRDPSRRRAWADCGSDASAAAQGSSCGTTASRTPPLWRGALGAAARTSRGGMSPRWAISAKRQRDPVLRPSRSWSWLLPRLLSQPARPAGRRHQPKLAGVNRLALCGESANARTGDEPSLWPARHWRRLTLSKTLSRDDDVFLINRECWAFRLASGRPSSSWLPDGVRSRSP